MNNVDITLYGIVDPNRSLGRPLPQIAKTSAENGATLIQYRDKQNDTRSMIGIAREIKSALASTGVPFIVNDRVDIALASEANGVHLGQEDMPPSDARRLLGEDAIIGLSIKTDEQAKTAPIEYLDYAFVGGVFETGSKENPVSIGISGWMEIANILKNREPDLPVGAIAGIDRANIGSLFKIGCDGVAMISALYMADDVAQVTSEFCHVIKEAKQ